MPVLKLGVDDVPYSAGGKTTGDVAEYLERRYHVMEVFAELHLQEIADEMALSMGAALQDALSGGRPNYTFSDSASEIKAMFNKFIDSKEMDGLGYPGVPTAAAQKGINHRLKHPFAKGNRARPSFKDTGLYEQAFRAWIES